MKRNTYMTVSEIAKELEISPSTVRREIRERNVPVMKLKRAWRIRREDAEILIQEVNHEVWMDD